LGGIEMRMKLQGNSIRSAGAASSAACPRKLCVCRVVVVGTIFDSPGTLFGSFSDPEISPAHMKTSRNAAGPVLGLDESLSRTRTRVAPMVGQRNERPFFSRQPNNATQLSPALSIDDYLSSPGYNKPEPEEHDTAPHSHEWRAERDDEHEPLDMAFVLETVTLLPGSRRRSNMQRQRPPRCAPAPSKERVAYPL
jgi:hypothetical protein